MMGSVVVDEVILPITDLQLSGGKLKITATARGPLPLINLTNCAVLGADAVVVYRSSRPGETPTLGPLGAKEVVSFHLSLAINNRTARPDGPVEIRYESPGENT